MQIFLEGASFDPTNNHQSLALMKLGLHKARGVACRSSGREVGYTGPYMAYGVMQTVVLRRSRKTPLIFSSKHADPQTHPL